MSFRHMSIVWEMDIQDPTRKLLLMGLASYANEDGLCWPGQEILAARIGCTDRTIRTHLAALEDAGWMTRETRSSLNGRRSDIYTLTLPSLQQEKSSRCATGNLKHTQPEKFSGSSIHDPSRENIPLNTPLPPQAKKAKPAFDRHQFDDLIPDSLNSFEFLAAWSDWVQDRKDRKKALTRLGAERQLKAMAKAGQATAIEAMQQSILNGWQGLYLDGSRTKQPRAPQQMPDWVYKKIQELKESIRRAEIEMRNYGPRQAYSIQECSKRIEAMQAEIKRLEGGS